MIKTLLNIPTLGFKQETIPYQAEDLTASNYCYSINSDIKLAIQIENYFQNINIGNYSKFKSIAGKKSCGINFSIDLYAMTDLEVAPTYFDIFESCGWKKLSIDGGIMVFPDSLYNRVPATIEVTFPGELQEPKQLVYKIAGCMGSVKLLGKTGLPIKAEFSFLGKLTDIYTRSYENIIIPAGFDNEKPIALLNSVFELFGSEYYLDEFEISSNEATTLFSEITDKTGYSGSRVIDRYIYGKIKFFSDETASLVNSQYLKIVNNDTFGSYEWYQACALGNSYRYWPEFSADNLYSVGSGIDLYKTLLKVNMGRTGGNNESPRVRFCNFPSGDYVGTKFEVKFYSVRVYYRGISSNFVETVGICLSDSSGFDYNFGLWFGPNIQAPLPNRLNVWYGTHSSGYRISPNNMNPGYHDFIMSIEVLEKSGSLYSCKFTCEFTSGDYAGTTYTATRSYSISADRYFRILYRGGWTYWSWASSCRVEYAYINGKTINGSDCLGLNPSTNNFSLINNNLRLYADNSQIISMDDELRETSLQFPDGIQLKQISD